MNDSNSLSPVLRDRVQLIQMETPKMADKVHIANGFLLPTCLHNVGLTMADVCFAPETLKHAIATGVQEAGVRQLKYCLEGIVRRVNMFMLIGKARSREILREFSINEKTQSSIIVGLFGGGTKGRAVAVTPALYDALKPTGDPAANTGTPPFTMYM
jgi:ATP-dependent Lon protease